MVVNRTNQWEIPYEWERHLSRNINLPKLIRMASLKTTNRLHRRKTDSIPSVPLQCNQSTPWKTTRGQSVHWEMEYEGFSEKYRAAVEGAIL